MPPEFKSVSFPPSGTIPCCRHIRATVRELARDDRLAVVAFDMHLAQDLELLPRVTYIEGDVSSGEHLKLILKDCSCCVHMGTWFRGDAMGGSAGGGAVVDALVGAVSGGTVGGGQARGGGGTQVVMFQASKMVVESCLLMDVKGLVYCSSGETVLYHLLMPEVRILMHNSTFFSALAALGDQMEKRSPGGTSARDIPKASAGSQCAAGSLMARTERLLLQGASHALRVIVLRMGLVFGLGDEVRLRILRGYLDHVTTCADLDHITT